ncbi:PREDICTED: probable F-box protein At4g22060 [Camelina sativa]|uniref:Probable F-box protein At4g22060 n=1 Tax=Camelina sativa TaxID=90675 RepID=A0ABM0UDN5_CAMSA|nr:PREDICTED: probable F-box protein At4g22060 [Camelina sativa]
MDSLSSMSDGSDWSKLPSDILDMIFKRLGFADFQRAKSVCPSWLYASRQSAANNQIPWLIQFPEKGKDFCLLYNPGEKEKVYRIQKLGDGFANSHCLAIYGSWLFMRDSIYNLYIMNLFTRERINLPSVESLVGKIKIKRTINDMFSIKIDDRYDDEHLQEHIRFNLEIDFPLLWIEDKTKDYVVMWSIRNYLVYFKKGDNCWKHVNYCIVNMLHTIDVVYIDHKIYLYTSRDVKILEFSGDSPEKILEMQVTDYVRRPRRINLDVWYIQKSHLVVTMSAEVLRVESIIRSDSDVWSFNIYKMDSLNNKWERQLTSLGDEAILLDQGITVLATAIEGVNRNSIYFSGYCSLHYSTFDRVWSEKDIFVFNLDTHKIERPHQSFCSTISRLFDVQWFVPNYKRKD